MLKSEPKYCPDCIVEMIREKRPAPVNACHYFFVCPICGYNEPDTPYYDDQDRNLFEKTVEFINKNKFWDGKTFFIANGTNLDM
jgi:hypothetical protein